MPIRNVAVNSDGAGADPEFLDSGLNIDEGGFNLINLPNFLDILYENEMIWTQSGFRLDPLSG